MPKPRSSTPPANASAPARVHARSPRDSAGPAPQRPRAAHASAPPAAHVPTLPPWGVICFFTSGVAGLLYEVVWTKQLSYLLGNSLHAAATVVAAFLGGLALGARFLGTPLAQRRRGPRDYALLELGVGVLGIALLPVLRGLEPLVGQFYRAFGGEGPSFALARFVLLFVVLIPPAALMGATLPVLVAHFEWERVGPALARLYALNTFGAVLGSLAGGFVFMPWLGLSGTAAVAALLNASVALLAWRAGGATRAAPAAVPAPATAPAEKPAAMPTAPAPGPAAAQSTPAEAEPSVASPPLAGPARLALASLFALSGLAALAFQIAWVRLFSLVFGSSVYSFSAVLGVYVFGLALGSAVIERAMRRGVSLAGFARLQLTLAAVAAVELLCFPRLPEWMFALGERSGASWGALMAGEIGLAAVVLLVPCALLGAAFPIADAPAAAPRRRPRGRLRVRGQHHRHHRRQPARGLRAGADLGRAGHPPGRADPVGIRRPRRPRARALARRCHRPRPRVRGRRGRGGRGTRHAGAALGPGADVLGTLPPASGRRRRVRGRARVRGRLHRVARDPQREGAVLSRRREWLGARRHRRAGNPALAARGRQDRREHQRHGDPGAAGPAADAVRGLRRAHAGDRARLGHHRRGSTRRGRGPHRSGRAGARRGAGVAVLPRAGRGSARRPARAPDPGRRAHPPGARRWSLRRDRLGALEPVDRGRQQPVHRRLLPPRARAAGARRGVLPVDAALRVVARDVRLDAGVVPGRVPAGAGVLRVELGRRAVDRGAGRSAARDRAARDAGRPPPARARADPRAGGARGLLRGPVRCAAPDREGRAAQSRRPSDRGVPRAARPDRDRAHRAVRQPARDRRGAVRRRAASRARCSPRGHARAGTRRAGAC